MRNCTKLLKDGQIFNNSHGARRRGIATIIKPHVTFEKTNYIADREYTSCSGRLT